VTVSTALTLLLAEAVIVDVVVEVGDEQQRLAVQLALQPGDAVGVALVFVLSDVVDPVDAVSMRSTA